MKRSPLKRTSGLKNTGNLARTNGPKAKPKPRLDDDERAAAHAWWEAVVKGAKCAVCGSKSRLEAHHVIPKQQVKRVGGDVWDVRNGMALCQRDHERHTLAVARIPRYLLTDKHWEFAGSLGLTWLLEREYPA